MKHRQTRMLTKRLFEAQDEEAIAQAVTDWFDAGGHPLDTPNNWDVFKSALESRDEGVVNRALKLCEPWTAERSARVMNIAAAFGETRILKHLLSLGFPPTNPTGLASHISEAVGAHEFEAAELLLASGAAIDECVGTTALHWAAIANNIEGARFLLEHGADAGVRSDSGMMTAADYARRDGHSAILALLHGFDDIGEETTRSAEATSDSDCPPNSDGRDPDGIRRPIDDSNASGSQRFNWGRALSVMLGFGVLVLLQAPYFELKRSVTGNKPEPVFLVLAGIIAVVFAFCAGLSGGGKDKADDE